MCGDHAVVVQVPVCVDEHVPRFLDAFGRDGGNDLIAVRLVLADPAITDEILAPNALAAADDDLVAAETNGAAPFDGAPYEAEGPGEEDDDEEVVEDDVCGAVEDDLGHVEPAHGGCVEGGGASEAQEGGEEGWVEEADHVGSVGEDGGDEGVHNGWDDEGLLLQLVR